MEQNPNLFSIDDFDEFPGIENIPTLLEKIDRYGAVEETREKIQAIFPGFSLNEIKAPKEFHARGLTIDAVLKSIARDFMFEERFRG